MAVLNEAPAKRPVRLVASAASGYPIDHTSQERHSRVAKVNAGDAKADLLHLFRRNDATICAPSEPSIRDQLVGHLQRVDQSFRIDLGAEGLEVKRLRKGRAASTDIFIQTLCGTTDDSVPCPQICVAMPVIIDDGIEAWNWAYAAKATVRSFHSKR